MNNELKKSLEMRQENLIYLLKSKKEQLELEKQHQIYGAIKEIELFIETLRYFDELSHKDELENIVLPKPQRKDSFLTGMREAVKTRLLE